MISAGFAETGPEGIERQHRLLALVRAYGARLIGPNCLGISAAASGLNATFAPRAFPPGRIGFSSQSGALGLAILERADARGLGLSAFVSIGNKADVSSNDLLEWWEDDPGTDLVMLYLESFGNPRRFARIARRVARRKPILVMKSGTTSTGARAASSHTAALAGSDVAVDALCRQAGVVRARTFGELVDLAALLSSQPVPQGRRVAVVTNAGGLGILCADACDGAGLELPRLAETTRSALAEALPAEASFENPVDMLGSATAASYEAVLPLLLADPGIDAVIALFVPPVVAGAEEVAAAISRSAALADGKPVLACVLAAGGTPASLAPVPGFAYPETAVRALGRAVERAEWLRRPVGLTPALPGIDRAAARSLVDDALSRDDDVWLDPDRCRALLEAYGIPVVPERRAETPSQAASAARELGFPVAVKTAAAGVHKSDTGGVVLGLADEGRGAGGRDSYRRPGRRPADGQRGRRAARRRHAGSDVRAAGRLRSGWRARRADRRGRLPARTTVGHRRARARRGGKGRRARARLPRCSACRQAGPRRPAAATSQLADDLPEVADLDLNPVKALPNGCVAVDSRIRLARPQRARARRRPGDEGLTGRGGNGSIASRARASRMSARSRHSTRASQRSSGSTARRSAATRATSSSVHVERSPRSAPMRAYAGPMRCACAAMPPRTFRSTVSNGPITLQRLPRPSLTIRSMSATDATPSRTSAYASRSIAPCSRLNTKPSSSTRTRTGESPARSSSAWVRSTTSAAVKGAGTTSTTGRR